MIPLSHLIDFKTLSAITGKAAGALGALTAATYFVSLLRFRLIGLPNARIEGALELSFYAVGLLLELSLDAIVLAAVAFGTIGLSHLFARLPGMARFHRFQPPPWAGVALALAATVLALVPALCFYAAEGYLLRETLDAQAMGVLPLIAGGHPFQATLIQAITTGLFLLVLALCGQAALRPAGTVHPARRALAGSVLIAALLQTFASGLIVHGALYSFGSHDADLVTVHTRLPAESTRGYLAERSSVSLFLLPLDPRAGRPREISTNGMAWIDYEGPAKMTAEYLQEKLVAMTGDPNAVSAPVEIRLLPVPVPFVAWAAFALLFLMGELATLICGMMQPAARSAPDPFGGVGTPT